MSAIVKVDGWVVEEHEGAWSVRDVELAEDCLFAHEQNGGFPARIAVFAEKTDAPAKALFCPVVPGGGKTGMAAALSGEGK